jgi:hypothetical protein
LKKIATSEPYAYQTLLDVKDVPEQNDKKIGRVNYANIPRKPAGNGYILYAKKELPYVRQQNPDIKNINQLSSIVGGNWKSLKQVKQLVTNKKKQRGSFYGICCRKYEMNIMLRPEKNVMNGFENIRKLMNFIWRK